MIDLRPATELVASLVPNVTEDLLDAPTPCVEMTVAVVLDHLMGLTLAFTDAALKLVPPGGSQPPQSSAANLDPEWREILPVRLEALATAWAKPEAWEGMTEAGGVQMPAEVMATVALDEVVIHGWDLARATGQVFDPDPVTAAAVLEFTTEAAKPEHAQMRDNIFGPVVPVPATASVFDRALGLAGRSPSWPN
jgi:uncharacterized protein (TIGR03086 family)